VHSLAALLEAAQSAVPGSKNAELALDLMASKECREVCTAEEWLAKHALVLPEAWVALSTEAATPLAKARFFFLELTLSSGHCSYAHVLAQAAVLYKQRIEFLNSSPAQVLGVLAGDGVALVVDPAAQPTAALQHALEQVLDEQVEPFLYIFYFWFTF
jgi:hypothetical protein